MANHKPTQRQPVVREPALAKLIRWCVYLSAFMPLIIWGDFLSPFHFGKLMIFRSGVEIVLILYIILLIRYGKNYLPPLNSLFWGITIFTAVFGLVTLTSVDRYNSFWGTMERMGGWFSFVHFWFYYVMVTAVMRKKEHWLTLINASLIAVLLSLFYGFLQKTQLKWVLGSGGRQKIFGTMGNPALFAGYVVMNTFLALIMFLRPGTKSGARFFQICVFVLGILGIFMTGIRGSVLGLLAGLVVFIFFYAINLKSQIAKKMGVGLIVLVMVSAGFLALFKNSDFVKKNRYLARYSDISLNAYTVQTRFWAWQAGFKGLSDSVRYVAVGYGPENFNIPFSKHFNPKFYEGPGSETLFDRAHNQFIEILVTMGIFGFAAYIFIYYSVFKKIFRFRGGSDKENIIFKNGLLALMIAYIIHNSFIFDTGANFLMFFMVMGFVNFLSLPGETFSAPLPKPKRSGLAGFVTFALAIMVVILINLTTIQPSQANYATTRAIMASWAGERDIANEIFKRALSYDTFGTYEIRHRFAQYVVDRWSSRTVDQKAKDELFLAIEAVQKNAIAHPLDYLPHLYLARSYIILGKSDPASPYNDLAIASARKALEISPTFVRTYTELAQGYLNKHDYAGTIDAFKRATELNPKVGQTWWYLGITQIESGDKKNGVQSLVKASDAGYQYVNNEDDLLKLAGSFAKSGDFTEVVSLYKILIEFKPDNPQYHASLALAYAKIGEIDKAVAEAKTAAGLDTGFDAEARAFVRSLGREW